MNKTFNIAISLIKNDYAEFELRPPINMISGDHGTNVLKFTVYDEDGAPVNLTGMIAKITCKCPSGTSQQQNLTISSPTQGKMEAVLEQRFFSEGGTYEAEVQLYSSSDLKVRNTLPRFTYDVDLSLLEDSRVVANEQFSILQQMVDTVATAEVRSVEALDTATRAMNVANQKGDVATEQAARAEREANRSRDEANRAWQADFTKHTTLDGEIQQNLDLNERGVVQDGLVDIFSNPVDGIFTLYIKVNPNSSTNAYIARNIEANRGLGIWNDYGKAFKVAYGDGIQSTTIQLLNMATYEFTLIVNLDRLTIISHDNKNTVVSVVLKGYQKNNSKFIKNADYSYLHSISYNKELTPEDIQHSLQVLNNSQSISEITTTNADGSKSTYKLASDSEHVVMRNGYNAEECLSGIYDMCKKEFVSTDGSPITVPNAIDKSKILQASIEGNTVKNYANLKTDSTTNYYLTINHNNNWVQYDIPFIEIDRNKKYKIRYEILENTLTVPFLLTSSSNVNYVFMNHYFAVPSGQVGIFESEMTPHSTNTRRLLRMQVNNNVGIGKIVLRCTITEVPISSYIPFGLTSTQAIISNNGMKYPIYHPTELNEDGSRKVISLPFAEDKVTLNEDGSATLVDASNEIILKDTGVYIDTASETPTHYVFYFMNKDGKTSSKNITSNYNFTPATNISEPYNAVLISASGNLNFTLTKIEIDKFSGSTLVDKLREFDKTNNIKFIYEIAMPIITVIPKELVPTIALTKQTNNIQVASPVKPSSFKVSAPLNKILTMDQRLKVLEAAINTPSNLSISHNYVEDVYKQNQQIESEMKLW